MPQMINSISKDTCKEMKELLRDIRLREHLSLNDVRDFVKTVRRYAAQHNWPNNNEACRGLLLSVSQRWRNVIGEKSLFLDALNQLALAGTPELTGIQRN